MVVPGTRFLGRGRPLNGHDGIHHLELGLDLILDGFERMRKPGQNCARFAAIS